MKEFFITVLGAIGAAIAGIFGGWGSAMTTLVVFMGLDWITGLIVAGLFHKSPKTETGLLDSHVGWKGLAKKCMVLLFVYIACRLDLLVGTAYLKDTVCIAYICNEAISLIENASLMGVPVPTPLISAIELLKKKNTADKDTDPEAK